jgi:hypothetical protein
MFTKTKTSSADPARAQSAFTVAEVVVATAVGGLILAQICVLWFYSSRSFASQFSYSEMDLRSQRALDMFSKNIRQCKSLTNFSDTKLVFVDYDDKLLTFAFNNGELTRTKTNLTHTLLKNCRTGQFTIFQRTPIAGGFDHHPTTEPNLCKLVEVSWVCSRQIFPGGPITTDTMQSARIALRVK